jgi:hypothetical protein
MSRKRSLLLVVFLIFAASACSQSPSPGSGSGIPADRFPGQGAGNSEEEVEYLSQIFTFHMDTYLLSFEEYTIKTTDETPSLLPGDASYPANLIGQWDGEFSVSPEGEITGDGELVTEAIIWAMDSEFCGYQVSEVATQIFRLTGQVKEQGGNFYFPVKVWTVEDPVKTPIVSDAEVYCVDPDDDPRDDLALMAEIMAPIHRKAMIGVTLNALHNPIFGEQIEVGVTLNKKVGNIEFVIQITPEIVDFNE